MKIKCFLALLFTVIGFNAANQQPETLDSFINSIKSANGAVWAVLVSTGYEFVDYRFHAGLLYTYHMLVAKGVQRNHIITMMNDSFINSTENPFPGEIYGYPGSSDNIYRFVNIDYNRNEVSANNFLNILKSNSVNGKKVLGSNENDGVIVYYTGYGAFKMLVFRENGMIFDENLVDTVSLMKQRRAYKKMMFVVDSAMSDSLFLNFSQFTDVQVQTSTGPKSASYVTLYSPTIKVFMASVFSIRWLLSSGLNVPSVDQIRSLLDSARTMREESALWYVTNKRNIAINTPESLARLRLVEQKGDNQQRLFSNIVFEIRDTQEFWIEILTYSTNPVDIDCYKNLVQTFQCQCRSPVFVYGHDILFQMYQLANLCRVGGKVAVMNNVIVEECRRMS